MFIYICIALIEFSALYAVAWGLSSTRCSDKIWDYYIEKVEVEKVEVEKVEAD